MLFSFSPRDHAAVDAAIHYATPLLPDTMLFTPYAMLLTLSAIACRRYAIHGIFR